MSTNQKDKDLGSLLDELKLELLSYINNRLELIKLDLFEKIGRSNSVIGYGLIVSVLILAILFFLLTAAAFFIGELIGSTAAGFAVMGLFTLLLLLLVLLTRNGIRSFILNKSIVFLRNLDKLDKDETE